MDSYTNSIFPTNQTTKIFSGSRIPQLSWWAAYNCREYRLYRYELANQSWFHFFIFETVGSTLFFLKPLVSLFLMNKKVGFTIQQSLQNSIHHSKKQQKASVLTFNFIFVWFGTILLIFNLSNHGQIKQKAVL